MSVVALRQAIDEYIDWLSDQPEADIRRMFANQRIPRNVDFSWTIGGTEYIVTSHFNQSATEAVFSKIARLLENELAERK
jgi:hypothetical protein